MLYLDADVDNPFGVLPSVQLALNDVALAVLSRRNMRDVTAVVGRTNSSFPHMWGQDSIPSIALKLGVRIRFVDSMTAITNYDVGFVATWNASQADLPPVFTVVVDGDASDFLRGRPIPFAAFRAAVRLRGDAVLAFVVNSRGGHIRRKVRAAFKIAHVPPTGELYEWHPTT